MSKKLIAFTITILSIFNSAFCQTDNDSVIPYIKIGAGYINDELMIDGTFLCAEFGLELSNNYSFALNYKYGETFNDKFDVAPDIVKVKELIYTEKVITLFMGYDFTSKNSKHTFNPQFGPFYSRQNIQRISYSQEDITISKDFYEDTGVAIELGYLFNFKSNISLGLNCGLSFSIIIGPLYYTVSPIIAIRLD